MQERFKAILQKIKDWWLKFNKTQRILFISIFVGIVAIIVILAIVFSKPSTVVIRECTSATEATEVRTLLTDNNISCTISADYVIRVNSKDEIEAKLVLGSNNISTDGYTLNDALSNSMTTTESDKEKKYVAYLQSKFANDLKAIDGVKDARVNVNFADQSNTIFAENQTSKVTAVLTLTKKLSDDTCEAIGKLLSTNVGNSDTTDVFVMSSTGETLYSDGTAGSSTANTASQKVKNIYENAITSKLTSLLLETGQYSTIEVAPNLAVDFSNVNIVDHKYTAPDGTEQGLPSTSYEVNSTGGIGAASGVAGTESNDDDTTYEFQNSDGTVSEYSLKQYAWLQNEVITTTEKASGEIKFDESSLALVAVKYNNIYEDDAKSQGLLNDMTWNEYKAANSDPVALEIPDNLIPLISTGSGIDENNITVACYEINLFYDTEKSSSSPFFILQIILAALIAGLLIFIIIRSTRPVAVAETEPELSVEDMLATTKEKQPQIDDIDLQDKSETRKAIEKFVDENPEAAALLLRNWLNDGWN